MDEGLSGSAENGRSGGRSSQLVAHEGESACLRRDLQAIEEAGVQASMYCGRPR